MRDHLSAFIDKTRDFPGDPLLVARAMVGLLQKLTTGFSESNFAKAFVHEIHTECAANRRVNLRLCKSSPVYFSISLITRGSERHCFDWLS